MQFTVLKTNKKMKNTLAEAAWMGAVAVGPGIIIWGVGWVVEEQIAKQIKDLEERIVSLECKQDKLVKIIGTIGEILGSVEDR